MRNTRRKRHQSVFAPDGRSSDGRTANGRGAPIPELCALSPFAVFCALYLGITENDGYAHQDRGAVARRFGLEPAELEGYLAEHRLRPDELRRAGFDLDAARMDSAVAPEGISRMELARTLFAELGLEGHSE